jgi:hypothetical protein
LKLGSSGTAIGTPVRCPACRHPNLAIDIWCERCGRPLDWKQANARPPGALPLAPAAEAEPAGSPIAYCPNCGAPSTSTDRYCPRCGSSMEPSHGGTQPRLRRTRRRRWLRNPSVAVPALTLPKFAIPTVGVPRLAIPRVSLPRLGLLRVPRITVVVATVLAVLLFVLLAYVIAARQSPATRLLATSRANPTGSSPLAAAIAGVEAKTGLHYAPRCAPGAACLSMTSQTVGQNAAVVVFSAASSGGKQCAGYVFHQNGGWHLLDTVCALPGRISPLVGHDAIVHVQGKCANVRNAASLQAGVVACLANGTTVHIDRGPTYADGRLWWHEAQGWMAHDFLVAP